MRVLHRYLGFLAIGLTIVYALSGISLLYRDTDVFKVEAVVERDLDPNIPTDKLGQALRIRNFEVTEEKDGIIRFAEGEYDSHTGKAVYKAKKTMFPFDKFTGIHKTASSQTDGMHWFLLAYAVILLFLALSSLFMFKPSTKVFREGIVVTLLGIALTALLFWFLG